VLVARWWWESGVHAAPNHLRQRCGIASREEEEGMATVNPEEQENQFQESVKLEKNTRGYNWSIRLVLRPGEADGELMARLRAMNEGLEREYGGRMA
jgi:hypothetical protein